MSNPSGWLPNLLGPVEIRSDGTAATARGAVNFIGFTVADNEADDSVDVTAASGTFTAPTGSGICTVTSGVLDVSSLAMGSGVAAFITTPSGANLATALTTALPDSKGGTGLTALGTGVATFLGTPSGANLASALSSALPASKGGTGITALGTGVATFLAAALDSGVATFLVTPSGANLASALSSALPASKGGTGLTSLGTNVATFLGASLDSSVATWLTTPSGANLASALTTALPVTKGGTGATASTGSGNVVLATSPTIATPVIGGQVQGASAQAMGALAIDWSLGTVFTKTLANGGNTITFSNQASGMVIIVRLTGASSTVTWPTVKWAGGTPPTQTASGTDIYTFVHDGTSVYGSVVQAMA